MTVTPVNTSENYKISYEFAGNLHLETVRDALLMSQVVSFVSIDKDGKAYFPSEKKLKSKCTHFLSAHQANSFLRMVETSSNLFKNVVVYRVNAYFASRECGTENAAWPNTGPFTPYAFRRLLILCNSFHMSGDDWLENNTKLKATLQSRPLDVPFETSKFYYALPEEDQFPSSKIHDKYTYLDTKEKVLSLLKSLPCLEESFYFKDKSLEAKEKRNKNKKKLQKVKKNSELDFCCAQYIVSYNLSGVRYSSNYEDFNNLVLKLQKVFLDSEKMICFPDELSNDVKSPDNSASAEQKLFFLATLRKSTVFSKIVISRCGIQGHSTEIDLWHCEKTVTPTLMLKLLENDEPRISNKKWSKKMDQIIETAKKVLVLTENGVKHTYYLTPDETTFIDEKFISFSTDVK